VVVIRASLIGHTKNNQIIDAKAMAHLMFGGIVLTVD